ncbi:MAG: glycosyltransferase family 4 protein [Candidatus Symbiothrix sp.]|jgi:glycosyltransferase involved in cell wall biosynthesis|nr:glycosyltransferase family 4 protein [Candidatus Symbiothrix sp.]
MKQQLKISYVTPYDASDVHNWSGTGYYIAQALIRQQVQLEYVGNLPFEFESSFLSRLRRKYYTNYSSKGFMPERESSVAKGYANAILQRVSLDTDVVFSSGSIPIAFLKTNKKKVFYTDATFASMVNYYPDFTNLSGHTIRQGNWLEEKALKNCDLAIYSSNWAAESAINDYHIERDKVKVVPFGANLISSMSLDDIEKLLESKNRKECRLLFLGVDWERKGGDIALQVARYLHEHSIPVHLDIIGINHPLELPVYATNHGFISKSTPEGEQKIKEFLSKAHFLLLPTREEAFGIVFCEASSFGLPSVTTKTGGVTTAVRDNVNGMTFALQASPEEYAVYIAHLFNDFNAYKKLAISSFKEYESRLNWDVAGKTIVNHIKELF